MNEQKSEFETDGPSGSDRYKMIQYKIGKKLAEELALNKWWENKTDLEIAKFQLFTEELAMPFDRFHEAMEKAMGEPIFSSQFGRRESMGFMQNKIANGKIPTPEEILAIVQ